MQIPVSLLTVLPGIVVGMKRKRGEEGGRRGEWGEEERRGGEGLNSRRPPLLWNRPAGFVIGTDASMSHLDDTDNSKIKRITVTPFPACTKWRNCTKLTFAGTKLLSGGNEDGTNTFCFLFFYFLPF